MDFRKMLINNCRKAMLDSITALDKKTLQRELKSHLKLEFEYKDEIERLNNIINELEKLIEQYSKNDYYYKYNGKYLKSEIINDLKELKEGK